MKFSLPVQELLAILPDAKVRGDWQGALKGVASLGTAREGDLSFLGNPRYSRDVPASAASVILLPPNYEGEPQSNQLYVWVENPSLSLALICERIEAELRRRPEPGIHPTAVVHSSAEVDPTATVGPLCVVEEGVRIGARAVLRAQVYVGREVRIGEDTWVYPQVSLYRYTELGKRVILHAGVVLGSDGFGYESGKEGHRKVPQVGKVVIEDDVEIGANSTIDRARLEETRIGQGTKIDNLVQIGHNVRIGRHCFLCSMVGISGSTRIGNFVVLAGQAGTAGHLEIGDGAQVGGQAGISKNVSPGMVVTGTPAQEFQKQRRLEALHRKLPQLFERVAELETHLSLRPQKKETAERE